MPWQFTDEDRARLQPVLDRMVRMGNYIVKRACALATTREGALEIIQGGCEFIASEMRERILEQVDRGEWAARGIARREDMDITIRVDAQAAYEDPDANLLSLSIQPTAALS